MPAQVTQGVHLPAPTGGVNAITAATRMQPDECLFLYNMIPGEYGLRVRDGFEEFCINLGTAGIAEEVRTLFPFGGYRTTEDRFFAVTKSGIWDVSTKSLAPPKVAAFINQNDPAAGYAQWVNFVSISPRNIGILTDGANGLYFYNEAGTGVWTKAVSTDFTAGDGVATGDLPTVESLVAVCVWKNRVIYTQRETGTAWYTAIGAYKGEISPFNFGNKFLTGGNLVALWNWTRDGGAGVDDYLIALSSKGDLLVYKGSDIDIAGQFEQVGVWHLGQPPIGRRQALPYGGDLFFLSIRGVVPLSQILNGTVLTDDVFTSKKIGGYLQADMAETFSLFGWEMAIHPSRNLVLVNSPKEWGTRPGQYALFVPGRAWGFYRALPARTWATWKDKTYFGTVDGRVCIHQGTKDEVAFDNSLFVNIDWSLLGSFTDWGIPGRLKRGQMIEPKFLTSTETPAYACEFRFEFDITPIQYSPALGARVTAVWDAGQWDVSKWGGGTFYTAKWGGGAGWGRHGAAVLRGNSGTEVILVGFDLLFDVGGLL